MVGDSAPWPVFGESRQMSKRWLLGAALFGAIVVTYIRFIRPRQMHCTCG